MKKLFFILILISSNLMADENKINLSTLQRLNLGIKIGALKKIENIPLLKAIEVFICKINDNTYPYMMYIIMQ